MTGPPATGPRTASSDGTATGPIDDTATSAATTRIGRSSLFNVVAQGLCTPTSALLVPKGYRVCIRRFPDVDFSGMSGFDERLRMEVEVGVGSELMMIPAVNYMSLAAEVLYSGLNRVAFIEMGGGFIPMPTPGGVPVAMISQGSFAR